MCKQYSVKLVSEAIHRVWGCWTILAVQKGTALGLDTVVGHVLVSCPKQLVFELVWLDRSNVFDACGGYEQEVP